MSDVFQFVVEIRGGDKPDDAGGLRDVLLAQAMIDVAPTMAWAAFREVIAKLTEPADVMRVESS